MKAYLHADVGVTHSTIHSQFRQLLATVHLHGIKNSLGLEASGFHCGASNVPPLCVVSDTPCHKLVDENELKEMGLKGCLTDSSLGIINPVWSEKTTECSHENTASAIRHSGSQITDFS